MKTITVMFLAALATGSLMGCASRRVNPAAEMGFQTVTAQLEESKLPAVGVVGTATVGSSMVSSARLSVIDAVQLPNGLRIAETYVPDPTVWRYEINIPPGTYKANLRDRFGATYFNFGRQSVAWVTGGKVSHSEAVVANLKFHRSGGGPILEWAVPGSGEVTRVELHADGIVRAPVQESATAGFKRELIYTGRTGNAVSILYREFLNDMARPAFSQQLQYDVGTDPVIGYKGARFEVLKADNTGITYRVLSQMD
ncbi:MAG TPA: hypothetical protein VEA35_04040 [Ramlibacter sp.]|nr:hypothetical protein [Candidatus Limnocylindrales bacterium]HYF41599.1 hypothetical protein [Ramlibacter sp.]